MLPTKNESTNELITFLNLPGKHIGKSVFHEVECSLGFIFPLLTMFAGMVVDVKSTIFTIFF